MDKLARTCLCIALFLTAGIPHAIAAPAHAKARPPAVSSGKTTPPQIKGGRWPALSLSGDFDPKQIANPRICVFWVVDAKGRTKDVRLDKPSGSKAVDTAIARYVRGLRWIPAMKDGKPVERRMERTFAISAGSD